MTALKAVYQFQVSKSPRLWNDNPIENHRNNHRSNQEITTEITNNHRNNPLISDKWPFHCVFFFAVYHPEFSQELERVQTLPRSRSCRITPVGGSARARPRKRIDGDESRIIPGVFHRKRMWWKPRFHKGWSLIFNGYSMIFIQDSWIFNDIHPGFMDIQWYSWWEKNHIGTLCMFSYQGTLSCSVWAHESTRGFFTDLSGMS